MTSGTCATGLHPLLAAGPPPPIEWHLQVSFLLPHFANMYMLCLPAWSMRCSCDSSVLLPDDGHNGFKSH